MTGPELHEECRRFARYLLNVEATPYVAAKYADAHHTDSAYGTGDAVDRWLVHVAGRGTGAARLADAYARLVRPQGLLRRKLVLLLALLETSAPAWRALEVEPSRGARGALIALARHGAAAALAAVAGIVVLGPGHLVLRARAQR